jgi:hypothetical protein
MNNYKLLASQAQLVNRYKDNVKGLKMAQMGRNM